MSEVMDGRPVQRCKKEDSPCRQSSAEMGRRKDSLSMIAARVVDFEGVDDGVDVPDVEIPLV